MKIHEKFNMGQTAFLFQLDKKFINKLNERMEKDLNDKTFVDASFQLSAKIKEEYNVMNWLEQVDTDNVFISCIQEVLRNVQLYNSFFIHSVVIDNAWINDQRQGEYQVVHKHSGKSLIGFASILYLKVPDFGEEINNTSEPHNGRTMLIGNCQGQFIRKNIMIQPNVGDFYIFPYDVEHLVYPFSGDGLRRTMSLNYDVNMMAKTKSTKHLNNDNI